LTEENKKNTSFGCITGYIPYHIQQFIVSTDKRGSLNSWRLKTKYSWPEVHKSWDPGCRSNWILYHGA